MGTYFQGSNSEIQSPPSQPSSAAADGLQTLYLMNPNFHAPYSDAPHQQPTPPNMLLHPPTHHAHALNLANFPHAPHPQSPTHQHHHFAPAVGNILGSTSSDDHSRPSLFGHHEITTAFHGFPAAAAPRVHYNLWGSVVNEAQPSTPSSSSGAAASDLSPQIGFRRPNQQGLSLTLSSQQQQQTANNYMPLSGEVGGGGFGNSPSSVSNGMSSVHGVILGSKYLKAAQELLDEVVNVGNFKEEMAAEKVKGNRESTSGIGEGSSGGGNGGGGGGGGENSDAGKHVAELSTAQRQELQMKKSKLVTMLDEVEQRYRQYHHQMQVVISSFEQAAGFGAAKSYTSLALRTISKQFRCLKDAITWQIKATSKALGEEDCLGAKVEGSRLRYVDHHLRQQRALQQLGMIQPNAWRPQRGLPERAVSILRAWLFEHFLHPYPKDSDKVMLAKQTGLTRGQVSNWFINARVRLWKPMVEEMYLEEIKEQENNNNNNGSDNNTNMKSKEGNKELLGSTSNNNTAAPESSSAIKLDHINIHHLQPKQQQECFNHHNQQNTSSPTEISAGSSIMSTSLQSHTGGFHHHEMQIRASSSPNKASRIGASEMQHSPSSILSMDHMEMKHNNNIGGADHREVANNTKYSYGAAAFSMEDIGTRFNFTDHHHHHQLASSRFQGNNGVSLTLGLPHNNNNNESLTISGTQQQQQQQHGFLSQNNMHGLGRRLEINGTNVGNEFCVINTAPPVPQSSHSAATNYESIEIQNRKRFAAQLLPDFVA